MKLLETWVRQSDGNHELHDAEARAERWQMGGEGPRKGWREWKMTLEMAGGGDLYLPHDPPHTQSGFGRYPRWSAGIRRYSRGDG